MCALAGSRLGHDGGGLAVAFHDELAKVVGLCRVQRWQGEVVEDEQVDPGQAAHLGLEGVVQGGCP